MTMRQYYTLQILVLMFGLLTATVSAQTIYYSKANATDFNDVATWGTAENGTGTTPPVISNANEFIISNGSVLALTGDATVRRLTINSGSLTVSAFMLNLERPGTKQSKLIIDGGTLNLSGGTINIGGPLHHDEGYFNQSGGSVIIDANYFGNTTGSPIGFEGVPLRFLSEHAPNLTGGSITVVDPAVNSFVGIGNYATVFYNSEPVIVSPNHTLKLGNGVSADSGGTLNLGLIVETNNRIVWGNVEIYGPSANNRHVWLEDVLFVNGDFTIYPNGKLDQNENSITVGGNVAIYPDASWIGAWVSFSKRQLMPDAFTMPAVSPNPQYITIQPGATVQNSLTNPKTNFIWTTINNSSTEGVTFTGTSPIAGQPAGSLSLGGISFEKGRMSGTTDISSFILGSAGNSSQASFQDGGFSSGTVLGKWYSSTLGGIQFVPGTDGLSTSFFTFPFVDNTGKRRTMYIDRVNPVNAQGIIAVTYNNVAGTTPVNVTDFSTTPNYTVNMKANDTWAVSALAGTPLAADSFKVQIVAPGLFGSTLTASNTRVIQADNFIGTHQLGTVTPGGQRLGITAAQLTTAPFTLAINTDDVLGTDSFDKADFAVYPNPVDDVLNVSYTSAITAVKIYNQLGQQVFERELDAHEAAIDMSGLSAGIYLVSVTAGNESKTVKIIKR